MFSPPEKIQGKENKIQETENKIDTSRNPIAYSTKLIAVGETLLCLFPSQERKRRLTPVWMFVVTLQICFPTPQIQENENKIQEEDNKIDTSRNISLLIAT